MLIVHHLNCFNEGGIFTVKWVGIFTEIIFTVNMPPIKNSPHKIGKSMLFFTFEIPLFSVMSINSQIYMTKPKQAQKTLSENTGKTFSVIMPPFSSKGGAKLRKWLYLEFAEGGPTWDCPHLCRLECANRFGRKKSSTATMHWLQPNILIFNS